MTLLEYIKLDDNAKNDLLLEHGELLDVYSDKNHSVHLFSIFNFFVEVKSNLMEKRIVDITPYEKNFRFGVMQKLKKANKDTIINTLNSCFLL